MRWRQLQCLLHLFRLFEYCPYKAIVLVDLFLFLVWIHAESVFSFLSLAVQNATNHARYFCGATPTQREAAWDQKNKMLAETKNKESLVSSFVFFFDGFIIFLYVAFQRWNSLMAAAVAAAAFRWRCVTSHILAAVTWISIETMNLILDMTVSSCHSLQFTSFFIMISLLDKSSNVHLHVYAFLIWHLFFSFLATYYFLSIIIFFLSSSSSSSSNDPFN